MPRKPKPSPVQPGEVWAVPVPKVGFCPLVVTRPRSEEIDYAYCYVRPVATAEPIGPEAVPPLHEWDQAVMGPVPTLPFRNKRWTFCGTLDNFDPEDWPVPPLRQSVVDEDKPIEEWGKQPGGEMWAVETTADEASFTVIDNAPAEREYALQFPRGFEMARASTLEQGLANLLREREPGFFDAFAKPDQISRSRVATWKRHAASARGRDTELPSWLPAGASIKRRLKSGMWLAGPLRGGGFGVALLVYRNEKPKTFGDVIFPVVRRWDSWPNLADCDGLEVTDCPEFFTAAHNNILPWGRWRVLGQHPTFDPDDWIWPREFESLRHAVIASLCLAELIIPLGVAGHARPSRSKCQISPENLKAWREQNAAIEE